MQTNSQTSSSSEGSYTAKKSFKISQPGNFSDYWYQGQAELNRFKLKQARYGQIHQGEAILVFVTEDFLTEEQVKKEKNTDQPATTVLKLNSIHRFVTGIYDYSIMRSVFTPVRGQEYPHTLKLTQSSQDWCGQSYFQLNYRDTAYEVRGHSYFQDIRDQHYQVGTFYLEDAIWTRIRLNPQSLPEDTVKMIPTTKYIRLRHKEMKPYKVRITKKSYSGTTYPGDDLQIYQIVYPELERTLKIFYEASFPHRIAGWEETYTSGFGQQTKKLTTQAIRTQTLKSSYWRQNAVKDTSVRKKLAPSLINY